jgi:hypothetical protein
MKQMWTTAKGVAVSTPNGLRGASAGLAQLVEHLICNQGVAGSNPATGTSLFKDLTEKTNHVSLFLVSHFVTHTGFMLRMAMLRISEMAATKLSFSG